MADDLTGKQFGLYEIWEVLGRGRMTVVYRARHTINDRVVALKLFPRAFNEDGSFAARFESEMQTIARLQHTSILPIYEVGVHKRVPFIAMHPMDGGTLFDRVDRLGQIAPGICVPIIQQVADALDHAHQRGVIHRDVKPQNVLFDRDGDAYLSDFAAPSVLQASMLAAGDPLPYDPAYMAPELLDPSVAPSPSSDVYSTGIMLYQLLTGVLPFRADDPETQARMHRDMPVPSIQRFNPQLTQNLEVVLLWALGKTPGRRLRSVGELAERLTEATGILVDSTRRLHVPSQDVIAESMEKLEIEDEREPAEEAVEPYSPPSPEARDITPVFDEQPSPPALDYVRAPALEEVSIPDTREFSPSEQVARQKTRERVSKRRRARRQAPARPPLRWYSVLLAIFVLVVVWFVVGATIGFEARSQVNTITLAAIHARQTQVNATATGQAEQTQVADAAATATQSQVLAGQTATAAAPTLTPTPLPTSTPTPTLTPTPFGGSLGRIALVSNRDGDAEIFVLNLDNGDFAKLTDNDKDDESPAWSADGALLAYDSLDTLEGRHIFVMDADGGNRRELTSGIRVDRYPLWSADGQLILFFSRDGGRFYLRSITPVGNEQELLQLPVSVVPLDWSPDNRVLTAFGFTPDNLLEVQQIDLPSGLRTPITERVGLIDYVNYSPDRSKVVYVAVVNNRRQLFLADTSCLYIHNCNQVRLTDDPYNYFTPRFSPDGTLILVTSDRFNNRDLFILDLEGNVVRQVTESAFDEYDGVWQPTP